MVRWAFVSILLLCACAQVGTITGGETDTTPPRVLRQTISDKQCNVNAQEQLLIFDEFIKLDQAQQRITLMPADSRLQFETKGKNLRISFLDPLQANTTYTLTSNGGIKDLTEGNDSLMTWRFSTGQTLDSLELIAHARECLPSNKQTSIQLALYVSDTSKVPRYLGRFDANGQLHLKGLKEGIYFAKAFIDEDQDGACAAKESQDQFFAPILLNVAFNDTLSFLLSKPKNKIANSTDLKQTNPIPVDSSQTKVLLSSLILEFDAIQPDLLVALYLGESLHRKIKVDANLLRIENLEAGLYELRLIKDLNQNQEWDAIDLEAKTRCEPLFIYPEKIKLRANWELTIPVNIPANSLFKQ